MERPPYASKEMYSLMSYCWADAPTRRPTFLSLVKDLDKMLTSQGEVSGDRMKNTGKCLARIIHVCNVFPVNQPCMLTTKFFLLFRNANHPPSLYIPRIPFYTHTCINEGPSYFSFCLLQLLSYFLRMFFKICCVYCADLFFPQEYLDLEPGVTPLETHVSTSDSQYSSMSRSCSSVSDDVISHTNSSSTCSSDSDKEDAV